MSNEMSNGMSNEMSNEMSNGMNSDEEKISRVLSEESLKHYDLNGEEYESVIIKKISNITEKNREKKIIERNKKLTKLKEEIDKINGDIVDRAPTKDLNN